MDQLATRPLRIAFFVEGMYASGVDTSTQLLARALRRLGHQVKLFLPWKEHFTPEAADDLFLLPAMRINPKQNVHLSYPVSWRLLNEFKRQKFDLVHVHTSTSVNLLAWQVSKLFHLPIVYTYHTLSKEYLHYLGPLSEHMGNLLESMVEFYDKMICDRADLVLTPSAKAADYLAGLRIAPSVKIVPNGVDRTIFHPAPSDYLQTRFDLPSTSKILLFVGRLNQEKRPLLAYDLFRKLSRTHGDLALVMVGDGAYRCELTQMALHDGLKQRVVLTGLIDHAAMPAVYNSAHLWVSTSQSEVQPMVALEAAACGLPTIAFADRALDGIVCDGLNGFVVESGDAFIGRVQQLLTQPELYQTMRQAALRQSERYSIDNTAQAILEWYEHVIGMRCPASPARTHYRHRHLARTRL
jgi:1,2-diacylglycerol 3-alpha-glucosyltransferase